MDILFQLSNLLVMPFWGLMILAPRWGWTQRIVASPLIALPPAILYVVLVLPRIGGLLSQLANPELATIAQTLGTPEGTVIAWAHFVAFDLFVGRWVYLDSWGRRISPWIISPILFFVLMLGPLGFVLYLIARYTLGRNPATESVLERTV